MRRLLCCVALVGFAACATAIPHLSPGQVEWAAARWPDTGAQQLEHGRTLYLARCSACHAAPTPGFNPKVLLGEMSARAHLSREEQQLVIRYLEAARTSGPVASREP